MTTKEIFLAHGITCKEAGRLCREHGVKYQTMYAHWSGARNVTPKMAVLYEQILGIPRYAFYPKEFWEPAIHG